MPVYAGQIESQPSLPCAGKRQIKRVVQCNPQNDNPAPYVQGVRHTHNVNKGSGWISFEIDAIVVHFHPAQVLRDQKNGTQDKSDRQKNPIRRFLFPIKRSRTQLKADAAQYNHRSAHVKHPGQPEFEPVAGSLPDDVRA